ncbi:MAG TPA: hypothetical protein VHS78_08125 [Candidatus Elarobacter sp.]|nr:hypothetical protein [Candidatus Elarobacter sp.]
MDVQAIDKTAPAVVAATAPQPSAQAPGLQAFPAQSEANHAPPEHGPDATLHAALSSLVGGGSQVSVQFKVVGQNEIVTVFKNAETGQEITQFPAEAMVLIAQFFNKLAGAVVDRTA